MPIIAKAYSEKNAVQSLTSCHYGVYHLAFLSIVGIHRKNSLKDVYFFVECLYVYVFMFNVCKKVQTYWFSLGQAV